MNKDAKIIFTFYILFLVVMLIYSIFFTEASYPINAYADLGLGIFLLVLGSIIFRLLQQFYQKSFWQLKGREKRSMIIIAGITGFSIFLVIKSILQLL